MNNEDPARGILHAVVMDRRGGAAPIEAGQISGWQPENGILWVHVDITNRNTREWLTEESSIDDVIVKAMTVDETRPRAIAADEGTLIVLRGVNTNPGSNPEDMVSVRIWLERDRIISSRRRKLLSVQDVLAQLREGRGPKSTGDFLVMLIERLADRIGDFVNSIEDHLIEAEENPDDLPLDERRRTVGTVRRQLAGVRRFLGPQRDALDRLYRQPGDWFSSSEVQRLREESDRITRYLEDLDLARERAIVLQEEILATVAQEQNTRMYVLSVVAAIFLPLTFVTGLLGMNVGGLPGVESQRGFVGAMLVMVVACAGLIGFFRWKRWL
ncbi:MAG: zinc transporter ZntB [Woeseiaceae bacterium]|nr:zinc transporter ZntB [Woeseiaceae bacterium]